MRRTFFYHEECLAEVRNAVRTSNSPVHEVCARCGTEGMCVEAEVVTSGDVRVAGEARAAAEILMEAREVAATVFLEREGEREVGESNSVHMLAPSEEEIELLQPVEDNEFVAVEIPKEGAVVTIHADTNETISELEQLSARIAQLEREAKEAKENTTT